jgi:3-oxoacyl-[acyl-carrier protein] reductase/meso-butanediol dehydrogenase/(S,S)-butanediol dehydrogenase/diacetyl reductase
MKIAIVSGGSKGIGESISKAFMEAGHSVVIGSRSKPNFQISPNSIWVQMDATTEVGHEALIRSAKKIDGTISTYINNVGYSEWRSIENVDKTFLDLMLSKNLYSTIYGCKVASQNLESGSNIINISSLAGKRGTKNNSIYCATKFGVNGITQSLAKELGKRGIRVNAVCPVLIETTGLLSAMELSDSPAFNRKELFFSEFIQTQVALNELPVADDVANMCLFLASAKAASVTGQCINVDSGVLPS